MKKTGALRRAVLAALLGGQAFTASAAIADGLLERPRTDAVHLEARDADCSAPVHLHAQCALCQLLAQRDLAVPTLTRSADVVVTVQCHLSAAADPPANTALAAPRGRSPPKV